MKCPKDETAFKVKEIEGINVEYCETCSGVFLKHGELQNITHPTAGDVEYSSIENIDSTRITELNCPLCVDEKMVEVNFASFSDIVMKYCMKCGGIWLEKGELDEINKEIDKLNDDTEHWEHAFRVFLAKLPF